MTALALLVVAVTACGNGDEPSVAPERQDRPVTSPPASSTTTGSPPDDHGHRVEITVTDGEPEGGVRTESVDLDEQVVLMIIADRSDEVHVHGYDLTVVLVPGEPAILAFKADKPGVWEVELHEAGNVLLELRVS